MADYIDIKKNSYFDSVTLMLLSRKLSELKEVKKANVSMGTEHNKSILYKMGFKGEEIEGAASNDLIIALSLASDNAINDAVRVIEEYLHPSKKESSQIGYTPYSLEAAVKNQPDTSLALISIPGEHVFYEAMKCLENNVNVMIFSDNVNIKDEVKLKKYAENNGLLVMGPDCGTAIINGKPLAFANNVRLGNIGIIGASGTGIQETSVTVHKLGFGISQAIGTGGRDLASVVGGITMLGAFDVLSEDKSTAVIILISKPPARRVARKIFKKIKKNKKPVIVHFIGGKQREVLSCGGIYAATLEDAAVNACRCISKNISGNIFKEKTDIKAIAEKEKKKYKKSQKYVRGLYTGGTLCREAVIVLSGLFPVYSNVPFNKKYKLKNSLKSVKNTVIDLGEDEFTKGRPHPMIDPEARVERLLEESKDDSIRIFLFDVMLGYGSHGDPAGVLASAIDKVRKIKKKKGLHVSFIASVCGVEDDHQVYSVQKKKLEDAGVIVMPTNARAVELACELLKPIPKKRGA